MQKVKLGKYKHYKGTIVEVTGVAFHSETLERLVVYKHPDPIKGMGENTLWVRPEKMFLENVEIEGKILPRFDYLG